MSYSNLKGQKNMFGDELRNRFYFEAIQQTVNNDSVVMDLGAGLGLHGFMANSCGAKKTYLVEPTSILDLTKKVVNANGLSEKIECISGTIEKAVLPEKVDMLISVFTGNFLLTEDLLPSLFYARDKYLQPGGKMIPDRANMVVVPVSSPEYYEKKINFWQKPAYTIDYSPVRKFAVNTLYYDGPKERKSHFLGEPSNLLELDFMTATEASCRSKIEIEITEDGTMHGCLGWFDARVGEQWISTSPVEKQMHWNQVFLPLDNPISVRKGEIISFELIRPEFGDWHWIFGYNEKQQKYSTFLSQPKKMKEMLKLTDGYKGNLSQKGLATQEALKLLNGKSTTKNIIIELLKKYPQYFTDEKQTDSFVKNIVAHYT